MSPAIVETVAQLRSRVATWRREGERVALVPTMGALHEGHLSLVREAKLLGCRIVVSIFVNPTQFGPTEDFSRYPRTFDTDLELLAKEGAHLVFAPSVNEMYPDGFATTVRLAGPATAGLEDRFRPTHFEGVATVVSKLLNQTTPDVAFFGQKDWQQLKVVTRMARDLDMPVRIIGGETIREESGLALSSRNRYLSLDERRKAPMIHVALQQAAERIRGGSDPDAAARAAADALSAEGFVVDYVEARHAESLAPLSADAGKPMGPVRLLAAARLGTTRLIDNIGV
jgi:pantoate--beta-alanine ligase